MKEITKTTRDTSSVFWMPSAAPAAAPAKARRGRQSLPKGLISPSEIIRRLSETVIGQDDVKTRLASAVHQQDLVRFHNTERKDEPGFRPISRGNNILLYGPSGSGKTSIVKKLAEILERPVVLFDATTLSPAGYTGNSVSDIIMELVAKARGDLRLAESGIIFIDEFDKQFIGANMNQDVSSFKGSASFELLRLLDGCELLFGSESGVESLYTGNILFILGGAFPNLDTIIRNRVTTGSMATPIGFMARQDEPDTVPSLAIDSELPGAVPADLMAYGIPREIIGRISAICRMNALGAGDMVRILCESDQSPLAYYRQLFAMHKVDLDITDEALETIARRAVDLGLGARGLSSVMDEILSPALVKVADNREQAVLKLAPECFTEGKPPEIVKKRRARKKAATA